MADGSRTASAATSLDEAARDVVGATYPAPYATGQMPQIRAVMSGGSV